MIEYKSKTHKISLVKEPDNFQKVKIRESKDSAEYMKNFFGESIELYESFFLLLLNRANNTIGYAMISQGGTAGTVVDIKIIAKYCIESLACAAIIAHNHPSGNLNPSQQDLNITKRIKEALQLIDCRLLDHLILTEESYYSFTDEGIL